MKNFKWRISEGNTSRKRTATHTVRACNTLSSSMQATNKLDLLLDGIDSPAGHFELILYDMGMMHFELILDPAASHGSMNVRKNYVDNNTIIVVLWSPK